MDTEVKFNNDIVHLYNSDCGKYLSVGDYLVLNHMHYKIICKEYDVINNRWFLSIDGDYYESLDKESNND